MDISGLPEISKRVSPRQEPKRWRQGRKHGFCDCSYSKVDHSRYIIRGVFLVFKSLTLWAIVALQQMFLFLWFQFKEISFAYEVLSNPEKKELYDRYGEQGLREGGGGGPGMDDIFSHIFGGGLFGFMGSQGRSRNGGRRRGEDMVHPLKSV